MNPFITTVEELKPHKYKESESYKLFKENRFREAYIQSLQEMLETIQERPIEHVQNYDKKDIKLILSMDNINSGTQVWLIRIKDAVEAGEIHPTQEQTDLLVRQLIKVNKERKEVSGWLKQVAIKKEDK